MSNYVRSSVMDSLQENIRILKSYCDDNKINHNLSKSYFVETFTVNEIDNPGSGMKAFEKAELIQSQLKELILKFRLSSKSSKQIELYDEFKTNFYGRRLVTYKF